MRLILKIMAIIILIGIIMAGSFFAWDAITSYQNEHQIERNDIGRYEHKTVKKNLELCIKGKPAGLEKLLDCTIEATKSNQDTKYKKYDLKAQQEMAEWAFSMHLATWTVAFLTLFAIIAVLWDVVTNRRIGQAQSRGYLTVENVTFAVTKGRRPVCVMEFDVKNTGNSPMREIVFSMKSEVTQRAFHRPGMTSTKLLSAADQVTKWHNCPDIFAGGSHRLKFRLSKVDAAAVKKIPKEHELTISTTIQVSGVDVFEIRSPETTHSFEILADTPIKAGPNLFLPAKAHQIN